jgi:GGDEF domain-containing protein
MLIDGVAASEATDRSGEKLIVSGADISSFNGGRASLVWEHKSGAKGTPLDVVGQVLVGKKIFRQEDCTSPRERYFWDKVRLPFVYFVARIFDGEGHIGADALAGMIRSAKKNHAPILVAVSIEGHTVSREGNVLTCTVARALAIAVRECNATCQVDILEDTPQVQKAEASIVAHGPELEYDPELTEDLIKALEAGGTDAAPSSLVGGAALQPEHLGRRAKRKGRGLADYLWSKVTRTEDLGKDERAESHEAPATSPGKPAKAKPAKAKPAKAKSPVLKAKVPAVKKPPLQLTVRGNPVPANPPGTPFSFDEEKGILHMPQGSLQAYHPAQDGTEAAYDKLLNDPKASEFHDRAMEGWTRIHQLMKQKKLPSEVVMHATLFSLLSPNKNVPIQELMYAKLIDAMKHSGHDPRTPGFRPTLDHWIQQDKPENRSYPQHSQEYFRNHPVIHTLEGKIKAFQLADGPGGATETVGRYHRMHDALVSLAEQHGADGRAMARTILEHKMKEGLHNAARDRAAKAGRPDPGPYKQNWISIFGLAPKTTRYALGMMGAGNVVVPDTHFVRHFYGLDKEKDQDTIHHLKYGTLWQDNKSHLLEGMDRWYVRNHPAVKHMLEHPRWGKHFASPEDAIFPAFWKHWMTIIPHERMRGLNTGGTNEYTDHLPYWDAIAPFTKAEGDLGDMPLRTALIHQQYVRHLGEVPASMLYAAYLVPKLLEAAQGRIHEAYADHLLAGAAPRLEHNVIELGQHTPAQVAPEAHQTLWPGGPQVRQVGLRLDSGVVPAGRFMILGDQLHHLEDYHGALGRLLPEGPLDPGAVARLHAVEASPHLSVTLAHDLKDQPGAAEGKGDAPVEPPVAVQPPEPRGPEVYRYRRAGAARDATLEVHGDQAYLDGTPVPRGMVELMLHNVETGAAQLTPAGLDKAEPLEKGLWDRVKGLFRGPAPAGNGDMTLGTAMQHLRQAIAAGHVPPEAGDAFTRHIYHDSMVDNVGNKHAWKEFRAQNRPGVYLSMDGNNFKHVNDTFGHDAGDDAITALGGALRDAHDEALGRGPGTGKLFRAPHELGTFRNGGDEFVAHFPSYEHALRFMKAADQKIQGLPPIAGQHKLSMSFGMGHTPQHADQSLYHAKAQKFTTGGQLAHPPGQTPNLAHSLFPGREGAIKLHSNAPPAPPAPLRVTQPAA